MLATFRTTRPEFGNVEAYARRHRRIVPILGTTIQLSLQQSERATPSDSLKRLVDGSAFNVDLLRTIVPSLRGPIWEFQRSAAAAGFELITAADDIEVALLTGDDLDPPFELEGRLRGIAARIVVALEYGAL